MNLYLQFLENTWIFTEYIICLYQGGLPFWLLAVDPSIKLRTMDKSKNNKFRKSYKTNSKGLWDVVS